MKSKVYNAVGHPIRMLCSEMILRNYFSPRNSRVSREKRFDSKNQVPAELDIILWRSHSGESTLEQIEEVGVLVKENL